MYLIRCRSSTALILETATTYICLHLFYSYFCYLFIFFFFFFNDTATTEIYTLSLHDALPIRTFARSWATPGTRPLPPATAQSRSEEHTSELQSRENLVCRLLLEKKKKKK